MAIYVLNVQQDVKSTILCIKQDVAHDLSSG